MWPKLSSVKKVLKDCTLAVVPRLTFHRGLFVSGNVSSEKVIDDVGVLVARGGQLSALLFKGGA